MSAPPSVVPCRQDDLSHPRGHDRIEADGNCVDIMTDIEVAQAYA